MSEKLIYLAEDATKAPVDLSSVAKGTKVVLVKDGKEFKATAGSLSLKNPAHEAETKEERAARIGANEELSAVRLAKIDALKAKMAAIKK